MSTYKSEVIQRIFERRWDAVEKRLTDPVVSLQEVASEILAYNDRHGGVPVSARNPANFFKDIVRNLKSANEVWPQSVFLRGYTGARITTRGACFGFVPLPPDAVHAFEIITPSENAKRAPISTLSIPPLARAQSRKDETWLTQVAVRLHVIETHLSVSSPQPVTYVELLQIGLKQNLAEIDALYMAHLEGGRNAIITVEAKTKDDIYSGQIVAQVLAVWQMKSLKDVDIDIVIPIALKSIGNSEIYVAEFEAQSSNRSFPGAITRVGETILTLKPRLRNL